MPSAKSISFLASSPLFVAKACRTGSVALMKSGRASGVSEWI